MNVNPYGLDDVELDRHAESLAAGTSGFGPEATVTFPTGFSMCTPAYPATATYVRVRSPDGVEIAYFDEAEFLRDAAGTLSVLVAHLDRIVGSPDIEVDVLQTSGENPYGLMPVEIMHRDASAGNEYGDETRMTNVGNGFTMTVPAGSRVDYVRICDPDGNETAYWTVDEFAEDPADVIGAMFGALVRGR